MNIFFIYKKSSDSILPLGFSKKFSFVCHKRKKILNQNAEIHYFEPIVELYEKAKTIFGNDKNIILNNCGVGVKSGAGNLFFNKEKTMQSSKYMSFLNPNGAEILVEFITLKDYLQQCGIDKIDVLKMDIEGMEFEVLYSLGEFELEKIENMIVEVHLLNDKMKLEWRQIFLKIKNIFGNVEIINSLYRGEIFLVWANKLG